MAQSEPPPVGSSHWSHVQPFSSCCGRDVANAPASNSRNALCGQRAFWPWWDVGRSWALRCWSTPILGPKELSVSTSPLFISHGFAIPVVILIAVGIAMTFLTTRTRFGRYVFAIGGNPEAAELAGIKTKWVTVKIFALMGTLAGLAAVISSARLNSATNNLGTLDELYVIAEVGT